jgi:hypothetical protein
MTEDRLSRATRALREIDGLSATSDATRRRILASTGRGRRLFSPRRAVWLLPLAATLVSAGAWATATGRAARWVDAVTKVFATPHGSSSPSTGATPDVPTGRSAAPSELPARPAESAPIEVRMQRFAEPSARQAPSKSSSSKSPPANKAARTEIAAPDRTRARASSAIALHPSSTEIFQRAHDIHFGDGDMEAALVAWDRYIALGAEAPLLLEARYNRAIALVKLGREDSARRALRPFAAGHYGGYRRNEATRLLESLQVGH